MRLLHVLARLPAPPNDGGAVYVYNMLKGLHDLGHDLRIVSLVSNKHEQDAAMTAALGELYAEDGGYKPYSIYSVLKSTITRQPITVQHRMKPSIAERLLDQVPDLPDVILFEGLQTAAFHDVVRKRFPDVPIVLRQVNVEYMLLKNNGLLSKNPVKKWFYLDQAKLMKRFELQKMKEADYVTAISENDILKYKEDLPDVRYFLNTAGATVPEKSTESRDSNMMLAVSNWRWKPNIDGLIWFFDEIWPLIVKAHSEIQFHIAGEGLSKSFKEKYDSENVHFLGFVDDISTLRSTASIFVAPLLSGSGMKLKILESLAAGLPTVTTRFGAEGINIEDQVHYLHADSADDFGKAVNQLVRDKNLREKLSARGQELIKNSYSWTQKARELSTFLASIVDKSSNR